MRNIIFVSLLLPTAAAAEPHRLEVGVAIGGHAFSSNTELGVADVMSEPGPDSAGLVGLRVAMPVMRRLAVEGEATIIPTEDDVLGDEAMVYGLRAHARFDLLTGLLRGKLKPFVVLGAGMHVVRTSSPQIDNDTDRAYHWGGGARYAISDKLDARVDIRHLVVPDRTFDGATSDYEVTAGMTYRFGARAAPVPRQTITRTDVRYVDRVVDLDTDNDGLVDTADTCPREPEHKNGWGDEDGCPDEVIQELAGVGFEHDSAQLDSGSAPLLDRAFTILEDNPNLSIEISGHTSSEGHQERNLTLSLRRAETVKAYLVKRGIAESRIHTIGHGSDVPIADNATPQGRARNRRIEFRILLPADVR
ncbi:MAG TPA: OmpA family protein [Kofleriaceae bacterium]|nr:OmpA family protein [Kofleriaceae bacterium]